MQQSLRFENAEALEAFAAELAMFARPAPDALVSAVTSAALTV